MMADDLVQYLQAYLKGQRMRNIIVLVFLLADAAWAGSATQPAGAERRPATELRIYDVRDYLKAVSDYPLPPVLPQKPTSQPSPSGDSNDMMPQRDVVSFNPKDAPGSPQDRMDALCKTIEMTVDPDSWRDAGGEVGSLVYLDGKLYIAQTPEAQAQVQKLVNEVLADAQRTVHVHAFWLLLTDDELAALREPVKADEDAAIIRLDDAALQQAKPVARAELLCIDGQTVHITAGAGRMKLQVCPTLSAKKGQAIVDVLNDVGGASAPTTRAGGDDRLPEVQQFHTTARIPLGADVVIGGMTVQSAEGGKPGRALYLVMRVDAE